MAFLWFHDYPSNIETLHIVPLLAWGYFIIDQGHPAEKDLLVQFWLRVNFGKESFNFLRDLLLLLFSEILATSNHMN